VIPPIQGLRELDGVWTNREVTELTDVPEAAARARRRPARSLFDVIQPFPSFSEALLATLTDLEAQTVGKEPQWNSITPSPS